MSLSTQLYSFQQNVFKIGGPILMGIGSISCLLNLMVFSKATLRKNPCTMCLIAVNIAHLVYFYLGLLFTLLAAGYDIDPSANNDGFCRFRYYIAIVLACAESSYFILASIDRTLITSPNVRIRNLSTSRFLTISLISISLLWIVLHTHALKFTQILQFGPGYFVCYYQPGTYTTFMTYYSVVLNGLIPPLLLAIFAFWTVKNIRGIRRANNTTTVRNTGVVAVGRTHTLQSKDKQLIQMLLMDIIVFIICKSPVELFLIYQQITQYNEKSAEQQMIERSLLQITYFWYFIGNGISCYTNILVSKTYRTELKELFLNAYRFFIRGVH